MLGDKVFRKSLSNHDLILALVGEMYQKNYHSPWVLLEPVAQCIGVDYAKVSDEESKVV